MKVTKNNKDLEGSPKKCSKQLGKFRDFFQLTEKGEQPLIMYHSQYVCNLVTEIALSSCQK